MERSRRRSVGFRSISQMIRQRPALPHPLASTQIQAPVSCVHEAVTDWLNFLAHSSLLSIRDAFTLPPQIPRCHVRQRFTLGLWKGVRLIACFALLSFCGSTTYAYDRFQHAGNRTLRYRRYSPTVYG